MQLIVLVDMLILFRYMSLARKGKKEPSNLNGDISIEERTRLLLYRNGTKIGITFFFVVLVLILIIVCSLCLVGQRVLDTTLVLYG